MLPIPVVIEQPGRRHENIKKPGQNPLCRFSSWSYRTQMRAWEVNRSEANVVALGSEVGEWRERIRGWMGCTQKNWLEHRANLLTKPSTFGHKNELFRGGAKLHLGDKCSPLLSISLSFDHQSSRANPRLWGSWPLCAVQQVVIHIPELRVSARDYCFYCQWCPRHVCDFRCGLLQGWLSCGGHNWLTGQTKR